MPLRAQPALTIEAEGDSAAGHVRVTWRGGPEGARYELQRAQSRNFSDVITRYRGQHTGSVLSGLTDGTYYYRVRIVPESGPAGAWSEPVRFDVKHHQRSVAFGFLLAGAAIFLSTLGFLVVFSIRVKHD